VATVINDAATVAATVLSEDDMLKPFETFIVQNNLKYGFTSTSEVFINYSTPEYMSTGRITIKYPSRSIPASVQQN
jgi:hypothetical protein